MKTDTPNDQNPWPKIKEFEVRAVDVPMTELYQPSSDLISEVTMVSAAVLNSDSPRTSLAGFRQAIASMALLAATLSALGQNDLQNSLPALNPAPPGSSVTLSNRAAKKATYAAAMTAVRSELKPPATMVELAIDFAPDPDLEVRLMAIGALLSVEQYIWDAERVSWAKLCGKMFRPMLDDIGIEPRPGESTNVPPFRASLLGALGLVAADPEVVAHWRKIASEQINATNLTWRPEMYAPLHITTVHGDAAWAKEVQQAFARSTPPEIRTRLLHALVGFRDPVLVRAGLDYALTNVVERREFMMVLVSGALKESAAVRFEWLKENYEVVRKRLEPKTMEIVAIEMISAGDAKLFADGEEFLLDPTRRTPGLEQVIQARKKELAPFFAKREMHREGLARALAKGLQPVSK
jgi:hypothetical protein